MLWDIILASPALAFKAIPILFLLGLAAIIIVIAVFGILLGLIIDVDEFEKDIEDDKT